ncbi:MAG: CDP-diacylglycerol--glycerol-3-phosphate 3-phosphatidyltransferase [bacterium]
MTPPDGAANPSGSARRSVWNVPNILTASRIAVVPFVIFLLWYEHHMGWERPADASPAGPGRWTSFGAAFLYLVAGITDLIDGRIARKTGTQTVLGQLLDPLADKLVLAAGCIMLIPMERLPAWVAFVLIGREILVTGLRGIASTRGVVIAAQDLGKRKATFQAISINLLILHYRSVGLDVRAIGNVMLVFAVFYTLYSGWDYCRAFLPGIIEASRQAPASTQPSA